MNRKFCPQCGNQTLLRYSVSTDDQGNLVYTQAQRLHNRGTIYSIPLPRGGRNKYAATHSARTKEYTMHTTHASTTRIHTFTTHAFMRYALPRTHHERIASSVHTPYARVSAGINTQHVIANMCTPMRTHARAYVIPRVT